MQTATAKRKVRLAYVVSHPIQYQANLLRRIAADPEIDLTVFFCSDFSARNYLDKGFGVAVEWDVPLLSGYRYVVLPRWRETSNPSPTRPIARGFYRHFRRGIDGQPFDALWIHGYGTINSLHAMLAAKALGMPVILRAESWLADRARTGAKLAAKRAFFSALKLLVDAVLPIGSHNSDYWTYYFGKDVPQFLVPYAVDNDYFATRAQDAAPARSALQAELNLDPQRPVILFASKLQERKHADHLLEAFIALRSEASSNPAPYLIIVGDGEMRAQLEARTASSGVEGVLFAGFRNQSELPRFFDLSSVFVLPSRHEAWGLITNEAMATGLPVIVTDDVGCARDLVRNGENGFVYPVGNIDALRDALRATVAPGAKETMGQRSRDILSHWGYREDVQGIKAALSHVTRLPLTIEAE